ncbi:hypothetical protein SMCF_242 [Streptomyces coelicoflavus ZG0656]|nr:hypothetical protein SMCF_242 [Streptomyces coelicoflavus ZG0656]
MSGNARARLLVTQEPITPAYIDRILEAVFAGTGPVV